MLSSCSILSNSIIKLFAISSAKEGKSGFIYNLVKSYRANVRAFHESTLPVYKLTSHVLTLKAPITKSRTFLLSAETF